MGLLHLQRKLFVNVLIALILFDLSGVVKHLLKKDPTEDQKWINLTQHFVTQHKSWPDPHLITVPKLSSYPYIDQAETEHNLDRNDHKHDLSPYLVFQRRLSN